MIFIVLVLWLLACFLLSLKKRLPNWVFYLNCTFIILLIGLRGFDVGSSDTLRYVQSFMGNADTTHDMRDVEIGYAFYVDVLRSIFLPIFNDGSIFLLISAILSLTPLFYLIKKESDNVHLSLLGFFTFLETIEILYFVCNRQVLGMAVALTAILLSEKSENRIKKFIILAIGAFASWLFHTTAPIIIIVFILLNYIRIPRIIYITIAILSYVFGVVLNVFEDLSVFTNFFLYTAGVFDRLSNYVNAENESMGGAGSLLGLIPVFFGCLIALFAPDEKYNRYCCKLYLVGIVLFYSFSYFSEVYRLAGLFNIFGLVAITYVLDPIRKNKKILKMAFAFICFFLFTLSIYHQIKVCYLMDNKMLPQDNATLVPYEFFWEDNYHRNNSF